MQWSWALHSGDHPAPPWHGNGDQCARLPPGSQVDETRYPSLLLQQGTHTFKSWAFPRCACSSFSWEHIFEDGSLQIFCVLKLLPPSYPLFPFASSFLTDRPADRFDRSDFPLISSSSRSKSVPLLQWNDTHLGGICARIPPICDNISVKIVAVFYQLC